MDITTFVERDEQRERIFGTIWYEVMPKAFADVSRYYGRGNAIASLGLCDWWSDRFVSKIAVADEAMVLDLCSGTHAVARCLLRNKRKVSVFAVDRSIEMTQEGQRLAKACGLSINAVIADAHALPYPDVLFDAVILQFATRHLRIVEVFREVRRVLKPGGVFYHSDMLKPSLRIIEVPYLAYLHAMLHLVAMALGSSKETRRCLKYFTDSIRTYVKPEEMIALLEAVGFENVHHQSFLAGVFSCHIARKTVLNRSSLKGKEAGCAHSGEPKVADVRMGGRR